MYKWISLSLCLFLGSTLLGQTQRTLHSDVYFNNETPTSLFSSISRSSNNLELNLPAFEKIKNNKPNDLKVPVPLEGKIYHLSLQRVFVLPNFIDLSDGTKYDLKNVLTYQGTIDENSGSWTTLIINEDFIKVTVAHTSGNYEVVQRSNTSLQVVNADAFKDLAYLGCNHPEDDASLPSYSQQRNSPSDCIDIYVEVDNYTFEFFVSTTSVVNWLTTIFNDVAAIYAQSGVNLVLSGSTIWNTVDPYNGGSLIQRQESFADELQSGFNGSIAHLFTLEDLNGGISQGIGGYCSDLSGYPAPFALTTSMSQSTIAYPVYSYNVMNVAHELGHVMGLRHTHACLWNGNNTQIDDCGNVYAENNNNTPEGIRCYDSSSPILPSSGGTIMSFCHLVQGNSINLANGFHPQVRSLLFENFVGASCQLGSNCGNIPPTNDLCSNAIPLTTRNTCNPKEYDNLQVTSSGETPGMSCGEVQTLKDVWFSVIIPASGNITIESTQINGGLTDLVGQAYTGSCGNLSAIACDDNSGSGQHFRITLSGRSPGEKIYVRVIDNGDNNEGSFGMCAYDEDLPCHPDYDALVSLYNATNGNSWNDNSGWNSGSQGNNCNVCGWYGVVCDLNDRVTGLNLGNNNLIGTIPADITDLTKLNRLNLYSNGLSGNLPDFFDQVLLLNFLDLGSNAFSGTIPSSYSNVSNLRTLYLDNNNLSGNLPSSLSNTVISSLWLHNNNFVGCIPGDYELFCLRNASLRLEGNTGLPYGGDYASFCADGRGGDADEDGYCALIEDCDDNNSLTYPGAPEICDNRDNNCNDSVDEGVPSSPNQWVGTTSSDWSDPSNWSVGLVPASCHDVTIGGSVYDTIFLRAFNPGIAASINIQPQKYLWVQNNTSLIISRKGGIEVEGNLVVNGILEINDNSYGSDGIQVLPSGNLVARPTARIVLTNAGSNALQNQGSFLQSGVLEIMSSTSSGIVNNSIMDVSGVITIFTPNGTHYYNQANGNLEIKDGASVIIQE